MPKNLLIKDSNIKIQDIAIKVEYNNIQRFIRFFKKYYHMNPIQYRRKMINL
ncbi:MAG: AraC family transcriptional regulator [Epulopiscium sp.]|nr:AraC family transcriptional regulator [Candidatus Epulonipiscium sp.]